MSDFRNEESFSLTTVSKSARQRLHLITIVAGLLLPMLPFLTGCGEGDSGDGGAPAAAATGIDASLAWDPAKNPSVSAYIVHYGKKSPGQAGSCAYENSTYADSAFATVTSLEPDTLYYFAVSSYDGLEESHCSHEVSTVTSSATPPVTPSG